MSLLCDVVPLRQATSMSCWWTCFRMMGNYAGLHIPHHPGLFRREFAGDPSRIHGYFPLMNWSYASPLSEGSWRDGTAWPIHDPSEWYTIGVPTDDRSLDLLQALTGLEPFPNRPALRTWTVDDFLSRLRTNGPFVFISNWNAAGQHAVVVSGVMQDDLGNRIVFVDPAFGIERELSVTAFNNLMPQLANIDDNPMFLRAAMGVNRYRPTA